MQTIHRSGARSLQVNRTLIRATKGGIDLGMMARAIQFASRLTLRG
jgi:hypothetical protein